MKQRSLEDLSAQIIQCRKCQRLVKWCEEVARKKRKKYQEQEYWGKPVPGFGDPAAELLIIGLAPAAHGANRTGRMFTGDRSGDWLYSALYHYGFASQPTATDRNDGLQLRNCYITAAVRCAPPNNMPSTQERQQCFPYLVEEFRLLPNVKVLLALGHLAWQTALQLLRTVQVSVPRPLPKFSHNHLVYLPPYYLIGSYHPSQQNTFTGKLTKEMWLSVFTRIHNLLSYLHYSDQSKS